jgi:GNAT superfamily N-acetyltransferase
MVSVREIGEGETALAATAMLGLRPRWQTADAVVNLIDTRLRPAGYRLVGAFESASEPAAAVMGFRESWSTSWGHNMYVDDLFTVPDARGRGHADRLLDWAKDEARRLGCEVVHLDSGVSPDRAPAHRLYMRHRMAITAHHFSLEMVMTGP